MAIKRSDYAPTRHIGVLLHKTDKNKFLLDFKLNNKVHRKVFNANPTHGIKDRLKTAYNALEARKKELMNNPSGDTAATVNDYWIKVKGLSKWSPKVTSDREYYYKKYLSEIGDMKIIDVKSKHITNLKISMNHFSQRYQKKAFEILLPIFRLAKKHSLIEFSPIDNDDIPKRDHKAEKKIVTDAVAKYQTLHATLHEKFKDNPHHLAFFLFGFHGRRLGEVNTLKWSDIDFKNNKYTVRAENSKIDSTLTFDLPKEIRPLLEQFKGIGSDNVFNVKEVRCHYADIRKRSGIQEFTYHWMRNLSVSALSTEGADPIHLSAMLGHNNPYTLEKYLTLQNTESTVITNDLSEKVLLKGK